MRAQGTILLILLLTGLWAGCSGKTAAPEPLSKPDHASAERVTITDPKGPIPAPSLPADLAREGAQTAAPPPHAAGYAYTVECRVEDGPPRDKAAPAKEPGVDPGERDKALLSTFEKASVLYRLMDKPPDTVTGLEQRLSVALGEGKAVLNSYGYYSGKVSGSVEQSDATRKGGAARAVVKIVFRPGPQYSMGRSVIKAALPESSAEVRSAIPTTLADVNLAPDAPAVASDVLSAVDRARDAFLNNGFPFAKVSATRYIADHSTRRLEAEVDMEPGPFVRMGDIERSGAPTVRDSFLEANRTWEKSAPWDQRSVNRFHDRLRESGLFQSINLTPGEEKDGLRPVKAELQSGPERTVSGALKYNSEFGPGVQAGWEHRNLTGRGDHLRITSPLWADMQEVVLDYRLPFFLDNRQSFVAKTSMVHADLDAYRMTAAAASAGIERRLADYWALTVMGMVEGGNIKEPNKKQRDYMLYGLPLILAYDNTGSLLNPEKGQRLKLSAAPYTGRYHGDFNAVRGRADANAYVPVIGEDKLIMALRGSVGAVEGARSKDLPPSIRFYCGGGGSVRGYEFQSLSPRTKDDKPKGGGSMVEMSAEMRYKVQPEWGLVAFVDGGTAYEDVFADPGQPVRWGAGLGFRYYTAIGPVRLDVASPLNPRSDDDPYQVYISIGQSF